MKRPWFSICAVLALSFASPAAAQPKPDDSKSVARTLAETGKKRFEAGDYAGAVDALRDAEKYFHAPTITRMRAMAHEKLGQLIEARAAYKIVADEKLAKNASAEFVSAQEECKKAVASLDGRIPQLRIAALHAPAGTGVSLDGKALDAAALADAIQVDPGKHVVVVEPPGAAKITREIKLEEKANEKVEVDLAPPAPSASVTAQATAPAVSASATATSTGAPGPAEENKRSLVGPVIAFAAGGAGLVAGAVMGGLSFSVAGDIRKECGDQLVCPPSAKSRVEEGKTFGYVSTVGFALAGAGAIAGVVLLVLPSKKAEPAKVGVAVGPTFLGVKGAF